MRLLVVEDNTEMRDALARRFRARGDVVDTAASVADAEPLVALGEHDVIVLDRTLGRDDALVALARWRSAGCNVPVLVLTARTEVPRRVEGFEAGADDYLGKPFAMAELVHRVGALARRRTRQAPVHLVAGDLTVDTARREVRRGGVILPLRAKEYVVLELLARRQGQVVTRAQLREHCWDADAGDSNVEEATIASLRRKLGRPPLINTLRGLGYLLDPSAEDGR